MATLWLHRGLLAPVELSAATVKDYLDERLPPDLPGEFRDDAGRLMGRTQYLLHLFQRWGMRLESLSDLDELTGVYNRRAGEKRLGEEIARAERDQESFHLALVDVRGFRKLCVEYGYETGDLALIHLVGALIANTRRGDWIAKWGTNQFLIGLHRNRNAQTVMQRIVEGIEMVPCPIGKDDSLTLRVSSATVEYRFGQGEARTLDFLGVLMSQAKRKADASGSSISIVMPATTLVTPTISSS
jgi:diguanylate cyclase (GGDEF)-like protein